MNLPEKGPLLPAETRWISHYLSIERLLDLHSTIDLIVAEDMLRPVNQRMIVRGNTKSKERARKVLATIHDPVFWTELVKYVNIDIDKSK
jgi:hypothetical protein